MSHLKVHTAQNVLLEYPVGNIGHRLIAAILDLVAVGVYVWLAKIAFGTLFSIRFFEDSPDILFFLVIILPALIYLPACEYLWSGRTVGKYLMKLKVVRTDGSAATLGDVVLRWLIRTIDVKLGFLFIFFIPKNPSSSAQEVFMIWTIIFLLLPMPVVGIISMVRSRINQRVGDRVANTAVIRNERPFSLDDTILKATAKSHQVRFRNVLRLSDRDIYIIKNVLEEQQRNGDYSNVRKLADKARSILQIEEDIKPLILLQTIVKDYNHLSKREEH